MLPARLGDTIFRTPLCKLLPKMFPNATIDALTITSLSAEVLAFNPNINKIFVAPEKAELTNIRDNYDLVINTNDTGTADDYLSFFNATKVNGFVDTFGAIPQAEKTLKYFATLFNYPLKNSIISYELFPQPSNFTKISKLFATIKVAPHKDYLIGLHLGCHGLAKKRTRIFRNIQHQKAWPLKNFIQLAKELKKLQSNCKIIITGSKEETKLGKIFCKKIPDTINLINKTSVLDLAALMQQLNLFITNDTGALHIACAMNTPLIALFGQSDHKVTCPFPAKQHFVLLHKDNITAITVAEVIAQINWLHTLRK
jgi:ADP-heptose:LPS heptosyltransferase